MDMLSINTTMNILPFFDLQVSNIIFGYYLSIVAGIAFLTRSQTSRKDKNEEYLFHKYELIDQN